MSFCIQDVYYLTKFLHSYCDQYARHVNYMRNTFRKSSPMFLDNLSWLLACVCTSHNLRKNHFYLAGNQTVPQRAICLYTLILYISIQKMSYLDFLTLMKVPLCNLIMFEITQTLRDNLCNSVYENRILFSKSHQSFYF